ncbi:MAG: hypothetical protein MZW92_38320 [Comamonadaceae bacterium]|nr:hypothetical protein [Comamonadaceae bacterium]
MLTKVTLRRQLDRAHPAGDERQGRVPVARAIAADQRKPVAGRATRGRRRSATARPVVFVVARDGRRRCR